MSTRRGEVVDGILGQIRNKRRDAVEYTGTFADQPCDDSDRHGGLVKHDRCWLLGTPPTDQGTRVGSLTS
jgi:hypothetical protein